jgi:RimJ/RimL family protein N-acetyltransferase
MAFSGNEPLRESFLEYLATSASAYSTTEETEVFSIRTVAENRHIGNCALYQIDRTSGEAQLGIAIGERDCWGNGYGYDAVQLLCRYAFDQLGLAKLRLKTLDDNARARRCFEKCGFVPCGTLRQEGRQYILMELPSISPLSPSMGGLG